ncbi:LuxR C-terminal-related transcriptional regulator [Kitasatospora sp. NBC_00240]|uniref:helix-turn-helix transcriptional regulator n=1 Tax=Kitasatospora sp. NBC_00240 TaxID=2903567 RepID=UPI0022566D64|nr:LuxR family transcriptional regulator [Kitasatospora sp. NBC_00240]MCX5208818.1 LuxR C-terminal-related transcriptional regulator [Kitasatospora sp. NBC_00240]
MTAAHGFGWEPVLRRALAADGGEPVLVWVEGTAGAGKSHLLRELGALPGAAAATRLEWRCGVPGGQPQEGPREGPVLLLVDDVHRADEDERERLRRVLEASWPGLAAVVTYRPEELRTPGLPLGTPTPRYPSGLTVLRNRLTAWDEERVRRAATETLGDRCTAEVVGRLLERSGGVPQVVVDLLAVVRGRPAEECTAGDVDAAGVPVRLAELVLGRMSALPAADRPIIWAAAVLGEPAGRDELIGVSGLGPARGGSALLAALTGAALAELDEGSYGFPAPLAASAVHGAVPGPLRQELHERAADVLTRRQPVPWTAVARHRRAAGQVRGWLRAVERAARAAAEAGRHQHAIGLLEQALASSLVPPQTRARLAPLLARSAVVALRSDQTVEVLTQIVRDPTLPATVRGELRLDLGLMLCNQVGRFAAGWQELETAAAELRDVRPDLAARAMSALAMPYWPGSAIDVHRKWLRKALAATAASGDEATLATAAVARASLAMSCGDREAWELVAALPTGSPDPVCRRHAARGLCNAADAAVWLGCYQRAEALLTEGLDLSAASGAPYTEHTALGTRLLLEWWTGRWAGLAERCERFVATTADMPFIASDARVVRGLLAFAEGDWGAALSWLSGQGAITPENMPTALAATASGALVRLALARQDPAGAAEQARRAWSGVVGKGVWVWAAELAPWAVEATARAGDLPAARAMVRDFAQGVEEREAPAARASLSWSRAVLAEVEGEQQQAADLYAQAEAAYGTLRRPYARALTAEGAARCLLAVRSPGPGGADGEAAPPGTPSGRSPGAPEAEGPGDGAADATAQLVAALDSCTQQFGDLGATWDAARVRALLRTQQPARKGRPPGRPSHADELSPRESEVAQLAASGLTNREIAATLHLSSRTVEQHVARAMRKTGAFSRHDLARHT